MSHSMPQPLYIYIYLYVYIYMIFGFLRLEALQCVGRTWIHMAFFTCHGRTGDHPVASPAGTQGEAVFFQQYKFYAAFETLGIPWELPGICWGLANLPCTDHVLKYVEWFVYVCVCLIDYHLLLSSTVITYHQISLTFINYIWLSTLTSFIISHDFSSPAHFCLHELRSSRCRGYITENFFRCSTGLCPTDGSRFLFGHLWAMYTSATREVEYFFLTIIC
jgi:hypothetical protein